MSTKLGTLTLDLIAKIGGFTGPIKDAEKQTKTSFDNMRKHVNSYGAMAIAGAAAVGAGVLAMANEYANAARELQTFASISNTTTQEFQKMAVGAETMGISSEKLADQLKDFNEKLGEFITIGSGGAVDFFEKIAIKTEGSAEAARKLALEMQNLSGPQALQLYVDKLEEAGVTQQQMSFYLESMASDTTNLIPLLKNGGEGFKFWADAAERAGVIMDESAIKKANELSVQMKLLDLQVKGAKNQFIQGLMPALVSVGDSLTDATTETNLMADAGATLGNVFMGVAAMGMGVYAVIKMLSNAIAGLAVDAVNAKKMVDKTAENGTWADKLPGIKLGKALILGTANARFDENSGVRMAMQDNAKVAEDIGNTITNIFSKTTSEAVEAMAEIQNNQQGVISGSNDWIKKQNQAASATNAATDALKKQQEQARASISYDYLDDFAKFAEDYKRQVTEIQEANFGPQESEYIAKAKARYEYEEEMYLRQITEEINTFKWSEEQKLNYFYETQRIIVNESGKYNDELKQLKLKALDEQHQEELSNLKLAQDQQLFQAQQSYMHEVDAMQERYRLEREEIEKIKDEKQRAGLLNASYRAEDDDYETKRRNAWNNYRQLNADRDGSSEFLQLDFAKEDASKTIEDSIKYNLITEKEGKDALLKIEEDYQKAKLQLSLTYGEKIAGSAADSMAMIFGEQSGAYKAMFAVQKGFAIAQSMIAIQQGIANAMSLPFPTNLAAAATVAVETASILSNIRSVTMAVSGSDSNISGMAHDGIDNIPKEGTWLLDKGERVVDSRTNSDLKNYLNEARSNSSGAKITVNNNTGAQVNARQNSDGSVDIDVIERQLAGRLGNPNSTLSKSLKQNTTASRRR